MDIVEIPLDSNRCTICFRQIVPKGVHNPVQPHPTFDAPTPVVGIHNDRDDPICIAHSKSGAVPPSTKIISSDATSRTIIHHASEPACPFRRRVAMAPAPAAFCSDHCRFTDHQPFHSAPAIEHNTNWRTSSCLPAPPTSLSSDVRESQDDSDCLSEASPEPHSAVSSPDADCARNAYLRLSAIYGFAPLPPPPPVVPKAMMSAKEPVPRLEGGVIMAARRIQAALCIDKCTKSSWGIPIPTDSEDDNKPIPGWTDGSNAWRPSVYGFAPPRDFTRSDPDDAAIRAYGSYVASPHRSRGVHSTLAKSESAAEVQTTPPSSHPSWHADDASTRELYRQYCASFARRSRSRTSGHIRGVDLSSSPTGSPHSSPREVPLLKRGAEGRLLVPNVKMLRLNCSDGSSRKRDSLVVGGLHCPQSQNSDVGPNAERTQSYKSETVTYPIMRLTPKKEKRVERRVINGIERDVQVEVLIEEPIKRLFLFGGARN